jgi:hypothetical protein
MYRHASHTKAPSTTTSGIEISNAITSSPISGSDINGRCVAAKPYGAASGSGSGT